MFLEELCFKNHVAFFLVGVFNYIVIIIKNDVEFHSKSYFYVIKKNINELNLSIKVTCTAG